MYSSAAGAHYFTILATPCRNWRNNFHQLRRRRQQCVATAAPQWGSIRLKESARWSDLSPSRKDLLYPLQSQTAVTPPSVGPSPLSRRRRRQVPPPCQNVVLKSLFSFNNSYVTYVKTKTILNYERNVIYIMQMNVIINPDFKIWEQTVSSCTQKLNKM